MSNHGTNARIYLREIKRPLETYAKDAIWYLTRKFFKVTLFWVQWPLVVEIRSLTEEPANQVYGIIIYEYIYIFVIQGVYIYYIEWYTQYTQYILYISNHDIPIKTSPWTATIFPSPSTICQDSKSRMMLGWSNARSTCCLSEIRCPAGRIGSKNRCTRPGKHTKNDGKSPCY